MSIDVLDADLAVDAPTRKQIRESIDFDAGQRYWEVFWRRVNTGIAVSGVLAFVGEYFVAKQTNRPFVPVVPAFVTVNGLAWLAFRKNLLVGAKEENQKLALLYPEEFERLLVVVEEEYRGLKDVNLDTVLQTFANMADDYLRTQGLDDDDDF